MSFGREEVQLEKITGGMIYYYFVCKRKLWFSIHGISMEEENENVQIGKYLDESSYEKERKHISINDEINIDFVKKSGVIHEIKKSRKIEEASIWQVKYYLYYLRLREVEIREAKIDYPLLKKVVDVGLDNSDILTIEAILIEIRKLYRTDRPPKISLNRKCKKCAYCDLCLV